MSQNLNEQQKIELTKINKIKQAFVDSLANTSRYNQAGNLSREDDVYLLKGLIRSTVTGSQ